MKVLIVVASRHGATIEIAEALAERLRSRAFTVSVETADHASVADDYGAVIIGSAVYAGRWMKSARVFVESYAGLLAERPVWLFSSGPLGDDDRDAVPDRTVHHLTTLSGALGHHLFAGFIDPDDLNMAERLIVKAVGAPDGDFRDWDDVDAWADTIADELDPGLESAAG